MIPQKAQATPADILVPPDPGELLLWCLLEKPTVRDDVIGLIQPEDFHSHVQGRAYEMILSGPADTVLLMSRAFEAGDRELFDYLNHRWAWASGGSTLLAKDYALAQRSLAVQRRLVDLAEAERAALSGQTVRLSDGTQLDPSMGREEILSLCADVRTSLQGGSVSDLWTSAGDAASEALKKAHDRQEGKTAPFGTGLRDVDEILCGGLEGGDLMILSGAPGSGKTALALSIVEHWAGSQGEPGAVVSMEMGSDQLAARLLTSTTGVPGRDLRTGDLTTEQWMELEGGRDMLATWPIQICDLPSLTAATITAAVRPLAQRGQLRWLVVDYLTLLGRPSAGMSVQEAVAANSRGLKALAIQHKIPVLLLAQMNREGVKHAKTGGSPRGDHLRDSSAIEQDADVIGFVLRAEGSTETSIVIDKHRNGEVGTAIVDFHPSFMSFRDRGDLV